MTKKNLRGSKILVFPQCDPHSMEIMEIHCHTHFFDKNFVKVTFLLKKILNSYFDEIFILVTVNFSYFHTHIVEKREFYCHANFFSSKQFRVKFFCKKIISRNFCHKLVTVNLRNPHCGVGIVQTWSLHFFLPRLREITAYCTKLNRK